MPAAPERLAFERVVVRLGAPSQGDPALEAGLRLAAALDAALEGLFVEDPNLLRLAALPFASETSALTGARTTLGAADVERALRVAASRHERRLAESAGRTQVRWSFAVAHGDFLVAAAARGGDLIVVGPSAGPGLHAGPIVVLQDGWPESRRAREAAARLARALERRLAVVVAGRGGASEAPTIAAALRAQKGAVVVVPEPAIAAWAIDPEALATLLACPLVIAR